MLEPGWVSANQDRFDVFHVHFGFDALGADVLTAVVQELKAHHKPLVYTVHDLRNPHHRDPELHILHQDILIAAADALITLTPAAAQEIRRRWDREATVLPHPQVLGRDQIEAPRPPTDRFVVGVHVKSLRANMDPIPILEALTEITARLPAAELSINIHDEVFLPDNHWYAPQVGDTVNAFARHDHVRVTEHPYFSDAQLWDYLSSLSVSVLPYRFGTHSGWLEACFDLGTAVIAPTCGFYGQQRPCREFTFTEDEFDENSLGRAVEHLHAEWLSGVDPPRATWQQRRTERQMLATAHRHIYEQVCA